MLHKTCRCSVPTSRRPAGSSWRGSVGWEVKTLPCIWVIFPQASDFGTPHCHQQSSSCPQYPHAARVRDGAVLLPRWGSPRCRTRGRKVGWGKDRPAPGWVARSSEGREMETSAMTETSPGALGCCTSSFTRKKKKILWIWQLCPSCPQTRQQVPVGAHHHHMPCLPSSLDKMRIWA